MTERDQLAAEYALGLLEGEDLLAARGLMVAEPDFAAAVAFWEGRLAPLLDEIGGAVPDEALWERIVAEIEAVPGGEVVSLKARLRFWQRAAAGAAMAAVGSVALLVLQPAPTPAPTALSGPLVASIPIGDTPLRLGVTYLPDRKEMLVSASGLTADGVHDHELWLVPGEGAPLSLGVVEPGTIRKARLDDALAERLADGGKLVLTREPLGGAPEGGKAGPVVAQGSFTAL